jgi:hypothetical protein
MRPAHLRESAWTSAVWSCALNVLGMPLELLVGRGVPDMPNWPAYASMALGLVLFAVLMARRRGLSARWCSTAFVVNALSIVVALWIRDDAYARVHDHWAPFQANKLGGLVVALLAPELWAGVVCVVAYAGSALAHWALFPPAVRHHLAVGEPWPTIIFGLFAFVLLGYHVRRLALEREVTRVHAVLAVRDLANTPLQIIELSASLLRAGTADPETNLDRIDRAAARLRDLNQILAEQEAAPGWSDASFDALRVLRPSK